MFSLCVRAVAMEFIIIPTYSTHVHLVYEQCSIIVISNQNSVRFKFYKRANSAWKLNKATLNGPVLIK